MALRNLSATLAAVSQLSVPLIAAFGGFIFISEPISLRFLISSMLILGGIGLVALGKQIFLSSPASR